MAVSAANGRKSSAPPVKGVKGIINDIKIKPRVELSDIKQKIQEAFRRSADVDANQINFETRGGEVILKGKVRSGSSAMKPNEWPGEPPVSPTWTIASW